MAELENIIEGLMSSPESMSKIMDVVKMFGGGDSDKGGDRPPEQAQETLNVPQGNGTPGGLDPQMLSLMMDLLKDYNAADDRRIRLLGALRPYLKPEDSFHVDKAIHIVKLSQVAKRVFGNFLK